ncbi:MAG: hypothetical protein HYZ31_04075 [Gammaproteobacteria bacterium]|jgi:YfaZ precursor|nr:hypothetical protein [Gammaproteobacteria bacterium]
MFKKLLFIIAASLVTSQANAAGVDIKLGNEAAEFTYLTKSSTFGYGGLDIGMGVFFNETDDLQLNVSGMVTGNSAGNNRSWKFGVGAKLSYASLDDTTPDADVGALAIGLQVRYVIPSSTPVAFLGEVFVAPSITSFSDAERYLEYRLAIELEVTPSARAYLGYRQMEYELTGGYDYDEMDGSGHVGVRFDF